MAAPVRMCVGCRRRCPKSELVRLVWQAGLVVDPAQVEPGRGAYIHDDPRCRDLAVRRRSVGRALRVGRVDLDEQALQGIE